ncbi:gluconokinase [Agrococcus sp. ARC_14]|uniref:gluconokinase n=1 Tax=Agrococcus sp. ARC_14 TaxID=2919927 RepID=UPI001F056523|nr:gluconokinase [Agrococcus sp. ARC_14]MCH1882373.1 gluconokinase [Agrococcus sp. ARC_14]
MSETRYPSMIIMGVQGSGKSTIGSALAERLNIDFIDGDDLHPKANKDKMASGTPLTDEDRVPWLKIIGQTIADGSAKGRVTIVACSALKRWYRELLRSSDASLVFVHLVGDKDLLADRLAHRDHEYMPSTLLDSQIDTLEPLAEWERGIAISIEQPPAAIVDEVTRILMGRAAGRPVEPSESATITGTIDVQPA